MLTGWSLGRFPWRRTFLKSCSFNRSMFWAAYFEQVISNIPHWQHQCVKSGRSRQTRELEEQTLFFKWNQRTRTDKVFTGREAISLDDSRVCVRNAISIPRASIKARPAGRSPMSFLKWFCQVCLADCCLIAAHHFWGPLEKERNQCPCPAPTPARIKRVSLTLSLFVSTQHQLHLRISFKPFIKA